MYSSSFLLYKGTKQVYGILKQREEVRKIANLPEIVSYMYQKAHRMSAVSKWAMLRPDLVQYQESFWVIKSHFVTSIWRCFCLL